MNSSERTEKVALKVARETGKPYKGQIEDWIILYNKVWGTFEGKNLRTSFIQTLSIPDAYVETLNSVYSLGKRA